METQLIKSFSGFSKLNYQSKLQKLVDLDFLSHKDIEHLKSSFLSQDSNQPDLAQNLIENAIGYFAMPLGLAVNFIIDDQLVVLPMAVEETSIIAAASKTASWICTQGSITTQTLGSLSTGQIQFPKVSDYSKLQSSIKDNFSHWKNLVNTKLLASMVKRGGGMKSWELRKIQRPDGDVMAVLHLYIETCEAMGANTINQVCEYIKPYVEKASKQQALLCILSNLPKYKRVKAQVIVKNQDIKLIKNIEEASLFAELDPSRACTSNKGVLNAIDALLLATGNDWRAVEAGLHAFACQKGSYTSLTQWRVRDHCLYGEMEAPFMLGTVGGVTDIHPTAKLSLKILGFPKASRLASLCCALGLVQNLAALRALVTDGVIEGHMKLHIKNLAIKAGANTPQEIHFLNQQLTHTLKKTKQISLSDTIKTLKNYKKNFHKK